MGFFDFVENFFFISLGVLFILVLLLVYHFKTRMSSVEKKGETMYELISNMVVDIQGLKGYYSTSEVPVVETTVSKSTPEVPVVETAKEVYQKIVVSEASASESESDSDSDEESNTEPIELEDIQDIQEIQPVLEMAVSEAPVSEPKYRIEDLKKMNLAQLKAMAVQTGILSDTSKMKKHELVGLLTSE